MVKAGIVLSREFCAAEKRESWAVMEVFKAGEVLCRQLPPALSPLFSDLQRLDKAPAGSPGPEIVLIPRFVDLAAIQPPFIAATPRKLLILLEWTVQGSSRNVVWLETVRGAYEQKPGSVDTGKVQALLESSVTEVVKASVTAISQAPEIRRLAR